MRASQATIDFLIRYYEAIESGNSARIAKYYTQDIRLTFGNESEIQGRENLLGVFIPILGRVASLHHDIVNAWEEENGEVIVETVGTWNLVDGRSLEVNAVDIFLLLDGRFAQHRMVADNTPLVMALQT